MYILGLNIGHNATACLLKDGKIIGCVSEERFSRIKNHCGIPFRSINYLLKENNISFNEIEFLVTDDHYPTKKDPDFGKEFLQAYTNPPRIKKLLSKIGYTYPDIFNKYLIFKENLLTLNKNQKKAQIKKELSRTFKFPENKILPIDHHFAHSLAPCFNLPNNKKTLIFTLDGEGSGTCATVSIFDGKNLRVLSKSRKNASLGYLYAITTIYLGMKPLEHEFKVMGLSPYAKKHNVDKVYLKIKDLIWIDKKLRFQSKLNMPFFNNFLEKEMKFDRFDSIAGAVQLLVEEKSCEWIRKAIKLTKINNIALSGGVFMNVKANQKISELLDVKEIFVMPSCGDESNAIGACFYGYKKYCGRNNLNFEIKPITDLYLGPEYNDKYIETMIIKDKLKLKYKIKKLKNINKEISKLLANGEIVARCSGKSEWGARALGNRSILANASHPDTIRILNETIKDRDFWMPFTPSILDKFEKKYIINPKKIFAPYMTITFNSTDLARKNIPAAMHPYDQTLRPQIVTKEYNKDYYEIIEEFSKLSDNGGILNTSFNLHGEPNVLTPEDAIHTADNSDLKYIAIGNYLFEKKL